MTRWAYLVRFVDGTYAYGIGRTGIEAAAAAEARWGVAVEKWLLMPGVWQLTGATS